MDIVLQTNWGWEIAMDLFLGGLGASCFFIAAILHLVSKEKFKSTVKFGAWAGVLSLVGAVSVLMLEVGVPERAIFLYKSFINFNSWMPIGAWFLFSGIIVFGLYALSCTEWVTRKIKFLPKCRAVLGIIGIVLAVGIAAYTGLLLSAIWAHPLWNTLWLPALVMASALCMGTVVITAYAVMEEKSEESGKLQKIMKICSVGLNVLVAVVLGCYLGIVSSGSEVAGSSVGILTTGSVSQLFWIIAVGCGVFVPLVINILLLISNKLSSAGILSMVGVACCLVGAFTLRLVILMAGLPIYA